jgi:hypothetical protein
MTCRPLTTVVTPAESYDLVSLENLKLDLGIVTDADDDYLQRAISRASAAVSAYCNRVFVVESVQDVFVCSGSESLVAGRFPIISDTLEIGGDTYEEGGAYRLDARRGIVELASGIWPSALTITYDAGFDPIPLDLQAAVSDMVKALQFNRSRDPQLRSENILSGLYAYTLFDPGALPAGTPRQVSAILDHYRIPVLA